MIVRRTLPRRVNLLGEVMNVLPRAYRRQVIKHAIIDRCVPSGDGQREVLKGGFSIEAILIFSHFEVG